MAADSTELRERIEQALQGDEHASRVLVETWTPVLAAAVRCTLKQRVQSQIDPEDLVQEVWKGFFSHPISRTLLDDPNDLLKFLTVVARNKAVDANRHYLRCSKCDLHRTQRLDDLLPAEAQNLVSQAPEPYQVVVTAEEWARLQQSLPYVQQLILELLRDGYAHAEVAEILSFSEKTIQRVVRLAEEKAALSGSGHGC